MMKKNFPNLKNFFSREVFQIIYGIFLILLIPSLIAISTIKITDKYYDSTEKILYNQNLNFGRVIYSTLKADLNNPQSWQQKVENIFDQTRSLLELEILLPEGDNFKVVASSDPERVEKSFNANYYRLAWGLLDNDALVTPSNIINRDDLEALKISLQQNRFWLVVMPMRDSANQKTAVLSFKVDSELPDKLNREVKNQALITLGIIVLVIILFLGIATRLWDYALLYRRIKEVDTMKDEFISMASHELRTPITAIRGYISMIIEGSMGEVSQKIKEILGRVDTSSERLHTLVEDLLNVSRIEQGRIKIEPKPVEVSKTIQEVIEELSIQAQDSKLKLEYHKPSSPIPKINADPDRLKQILINIVSNAIKYTVKGSVEVFLESKNGSIEIKIKDTGIGMSAEQRNHLFEKFYRIKDDRTKKVKGTGLGLWITKQLVELQKGKIFVDSIENVGTQVTIVFPVIK